MSVEGFPKSKSATAANQAALQGAQGTGASYDPPTGGSGVFGWLSGIHKTLTATATATVGNATIAVGGTSQIMITAKTRKGYWVKNTSGGDLTINRSGGTATPSNFAISSGGYFETPVWENVSTKIEIYGATTGQTYQYGECV